jgi:hypothetical protein
MNYPHCQRLKEQLVVDMQNIKKYHIVLMPPYHKPPSKQK